MLSFKISKFLLLYMCHVAYSETEIPAVSYSGHKVYEVIPQTQDHLDYLLTLENDTRHIKYWTRPAGVWNNVLIQVSPEELVTFQRTLVDNHMPFAVKVPDLQRKIDSEANDNFPILLFKVMGPDAFDLGQYHTLDEIYSYMDLLSKKYPELAEVVVIGKSYEGRDIKMIGIGAPQTHQKQVVFMDCGIHAREWISPATALYIIKKLLTEPTDNVASTRRLIDLFDWYIIPVANPDGYVYSWTKDRMWRKNRRPHLSSRNCIGVDLNRNFDAGYVSPNVVKPCWETYPGLSAFSEPETKAIKNFLEPFKGRLTMAISLHSFMQSWVTPFNYKTAFPHNYSQLEPLIIKSLEAVRRVNQTLYTYGPGSVIGYIAAGTSVDWYHEALGVKYPVIMELRDKGDHGFLLPKQQILPTGEETWVGIKEFSHLIEKAENL